MKSHPLPGAYYLEWRYLLIYENLKSEIYGRDYPITLVNIGFSPIEIPTC